MDINSWHRILLGHVRVEDAGFGWEASKAYCKCTVRFGAKWSRARVLIKQRDLAKGSWWHQGWVFVLKKEGHGELEEAVMRREKRSWQKGMVTGLKGARQSRGSAFPICSLISSWRMHTCWHRCWPWSKTDMARLPGLSILFHNMRWGGLRNFKEQWYWKLSLRLFVMVGCLQKKKNYHNNFSSCIHTPLQSDL